MSIVGSENVLQYKTKDAWTGKELSAIFPLSMLPYFSVFSVIYLVSREFRGDSLDHTLRCKPKIHVVIIIIIIKGS